MNTVAKTRYEYLDVLRGWAAVAVCVQHILGYVYHTYGSAHPMHGMINFLIAESIDWGRFGVVLFFLISGFIIPNSLKPGSRINRFIISRFFRLYPAYWITLILIVVSAPYLEGQVSYSATQFFANITMAPKLFGSSEMSGVFWTLFIEIIFYMCCMLLFQLKCLDKPAVIGVVALGLNLIAPAAILLNQYGQPGFPVPFLLFHLSFLFGGNLLRLAFADKQRLAEYGSIAFLLLNALTIPLVSGLFFTVPEAVDKGFVMFTPHAVVYAYALAIGLFMFAVFSKSLSNRFMVGVGEISYSLYLLHMLCFVLVTKFVQPATAGSFFIYLLASACLSYGVAKLSFRYIEQPAIEIGKKLAKSV